MSLVNVVTNPGFEDGVTDWAVTSGEPSAITADQTYVHSGSYAGKCSPTMTPNGSCYPTQGPVPVLPNSSYTWNVWIYSPTAGTQVQFDPQVASINYFSSAQTVPQGVWTEFSYTFDTASDTHYLTNLAFIFTSMAGPVWIDDVFVSTPSDIGAGGDLTAAAYLTAQHTLLYPVSAQMKITWNVLISVSSNPLQLEWNTGQSMPGILALAEPGWISMQGGA